MEQYYHRLVNYISYRLSDKTMAADIVHDAYLKVFAAEAKGEGKLEYPQAMLYKTATNLLIDYFRRSKTRGARSLEDMGDYEGDSLDTPHERHHLAQRVALLDTALGELSITCRTAFLMRKVEGLGHPEISERLQISKASVEKHIVLAMRHCRTRVRDMEQTR